MAMKMQEVMRFERCEKGKIDRIRSLFGYGKERKRYSVRSLTYKIGWSMY